MSLDQTSLSLSEVLKEGEEETREREDYIPHSTDTESDSSIDETTHHLFSEVQNRISKIKKKIRSKKVHLAPVSDRRIQDVKLYQDEQIDSFLKSFSLKKRTSTRTKREQRKDDRAQKREDKQNKKQRNIKGRK